MKAAAFVLAIVLLASVQMAAAEPVLPKLVVEKIEPQPVEPGQDLVVDITLFNELNTKTARFDVFLDAQAPFSLKSAEKGLEEVEVCGGCRIKNTYFLTIDSTATSGTYPLQVILSSGGAEITERIDVNIQGKPDIVFRVPTGGLDEITPGSQFTVDMAVENVGTGQARQVKIYPQSSSFIVLGSSIKSIDTVAAKESKIISFDFVAATSIEANSYSIPFSISYLDEKGNAINESQSLGLKVVNKGSISVQAIKVASGTGSSAITAGEPFSIVVRLENVGEGDADFIAAELDCPFNGPKKAFLGQLKKDEDAPAVFDLTATDGGNFMCGLLVSYTDDTGLHQFSEKFDVSVSPANYLGSAAIVVVVIVLAFVFRKRVFKMLGIKR